MVDIIFMGTPSMAVPTLDKLVEKGFNVKLVVCQPDKPQGRGQKLKPCSVKEAALKHNIEVFQPEKLRNNSEALEKLKSYDFDFLVVVAYGKILPKEVLNLPKKAPVNVHFSLLPKYRGAAPVNWAIINGESLTGVSTMLMDEGLDTGDILLVEKVDVDRKNSEELSLELSEVGGKLLIETLNTFESIIPQKQDEKNTCYAPIIKKEDGFIDFNEDATVIERKIRGFYPWPTAWTKLGDLTFKIFGADVVESDRDLAVGTVFDTDKKGFKIKCGSNALAVKDVQLEGKKRMDVKSFLSGYKIVDGTIFGK